MLKRIMGGLVLLVAGAVVVGVFVASGLPALDVLKVVAILGAGVISFVASRSDKPWGTPVSIILTLGLLVTMSFAMGVAWWYVPVAALVICLVSILVFCLIAGIVLLLDWSWDAVRGK